MLSYKKFNFLYSSFGDSKIIPFISPEEFEAVLGIAPVNA